VERLADSGEDDVDEGPEADVPDTEIPEA